MTVRIVSMSSLLSVQDWVERMQKDLVSLIDAESGAQNLPEVKAHPRVGASGTISNVRRLLYIWNRAAESTLQWPEYLNLFWL